MARMFQFVQQLITVGEEIVFGLPKYIAYQQRYIIVDSIFRFSQEKEFFSRKGNHGSFQLVARCETHIVCLLFKNTMIDMQ
jgi:hypothetical protein